LPSRFWGGGGKTRLLTANAKGKQDANCKEKESATMTGAQHKRGERAWKEHQRGVPSQERGGECWLVPEGEKKRKR